MDATSILSTPGSASSVAQTIQKRTQLSREEFFKVLTAQLTQQNPMQPMDSQDFLAQLVQLQNLEVTSDLSKNFAGLISQSAFTSAGALLGKVVRGTDEFGQQASGLVRSVSIQEGQIRLLVGDTAMRLENVVEVVNLPSQP